MSTSNVVSTETSESAISAAVAHLDVALLRYWNPTLGDHFYTTDWSELGDGKDGWTFEETQCYVAKTAQVGTVPLYRYWNSTIGDHFYTTSWSELGSGKWGYAFERVACYVFGDDSHGGV